ncbi:MULTISPECIES: hypothetical protein [unclassified Aureimonas]|uniref:hypothetical protein n=1 Tax=unclassified Aureimonas TaxID=2615206 RepID=UPI0006F90E78|nr:MULTISPECIES: hypothetical protein [unclassified Aureimonas]KQT52202.1 hypothetical protein ASG62_16215 [Aureimonas sp. Leaf427]KQT70565.1 hypothetical protein ASG54_21735 [Aureimonas sp. Leaf460]
MASKRRLRRKSCTSKVRHETEGSAWGVVRNLIRKGKGDGLRAYRCGNCSGWHVGHPIGSGNSGLLIACRSARPHH